jgi:hypothetical protein
MCFFQGRKQKPLDVSTCVPILISSDFLKMDGLTDACIDYVAANLRAVAAMPIDLSCLAEPLLNKLATLANVSALEEVRDYQSLGSIGSLGSLKEDKDKSEKEHAGSSVRQLLVSATPE